MVDVARAAETLAREGWTVVVDGQEIACAPPFETPRSQAVLFRLRPGRRIPAHAHSAIDDIFFCVRGRGTIRTRDADGTAREHAIAPVTVVVVPPGPRTRWRARATSSATRSSRRRRSKRNRDSTVSSDEVIGEVFIVGPELWGVTAVRGTAHRAGDAGATERPFLDTPGGRPYRRVYPGAQPV
jgi:quercetin dioxygenase-like cupin family protein